MIVRGSLGDLIVMQRLQAILDKAAGIPLLLKRSCCWGGICRQLGAPKVLGSEFRLTALSVPTRWHSPHSRKGVGPQTNSPIP